MVVKADKALNSSSVGFSPIYDRLKKVTRISRVMLVLTKVTSTERASLARCKKRSFTNPDPGVVSVV